MDTSDEYKDHSWLAEADETKGHEYHMCLSDEDEFSDNDVQEVEQEKSDSSEDEIEENNEENGPYCTYMLGRDKMTTWNTAPLQNKPARDERNEISPGVKDEWRHSSTPSECWGLFFTDEMVQEIVDCTNINLQNSRKNYSRDPDCPDTSVNEVKALFGLLYLAGVLKSSHVNLKDLWDTDGTTPDYFRTVMTYTRFYNLLAALRFDDTRTVNERKKFDKLAPIRKIFDDFNERCVQVYTIGQFVTIDKMMEAFRGKCSFKQLNRNKLEKYGLKINAIVDSRTFYVAKMEVSCGQQPPGPFEVDVTSAGVVKRLLEPFANSWRNVTMDASYCSVPLVDELFEKFKTTVTGTLRKKSPEIPLTFLSTRRRPVNSSLCGFQTNCTLVSYMIKKKENVILISSLHDPNKISYVKSKSDIYQTYTNAKGCVDAVSNMKEEFSVARVSGRWPHTIFFALMNIAGINSHIVYRENSRIIQTRRDYLKSLAKELTKPFMVTRAACSQISQELLTAIKRYAEVRESEPNPMQLLHIDYGPESNHGADIKKEKEDEDEETSNVEDRNARAKCAYCPRRKNRKTKARCADCQIPICKEHTEAVCIKCRKLV